MPYPVNGRKTGHNPASRISGASLFKGTDTVPPDSPTKRTQLQVFETAGAEDMTGEALPDLAGRMAQVVAHRAL